MKRVPLVVGSLLVLGLIGLAHGTEKGKITGYMFGDYYWVVSADDAATKLPEKRNAFQFRRIYFTYDKGIAEDFSMRYRLEANDAGFGSGDKMKPFVKHAFLKWKKAVGGIDLYIGLSGTPTWSASEKVWGYRSVEKTLLDLNKIGSSADLGVSLKGKAGKLAYHLAVGNGPGQKSEDDNGKKLYGQVRLKAADGVTLVGYADFNMRPGGEDQLTVKGFAGVQKESIQGGVELFTRVNKAVGKVKEAGGDVTISGASVFGRLGLAEQLKCFGRVDAVTNNDLDTTDLLVIVGLDHTPAKNVHLIPNLYVQIPDGPDPNIQARLTFYFKFI